MVILALVQKSKQNQHISVFARSSTRAAVGPFDLLSMTWELIKWQKGGGLSIPTRHLDIVGTPNPVCHSVRCCGHIIAEQGHCFQCRSDLVVKFHPSFGFQIEFRCWQGLPMDWGFIADGSRRDFYCLSRPYLGSLLCPILVGLLLLLLSWLASKRVHRFSRYTGRGGSIWIRMGHRSLWYTLGVSIDHYNVQSRCESNRFNVLITLGVKVGWVDLSGRPALAPQNPNTPLWKQEPQMFIFAISKRRLWPQESSYLSDVALFVGWLAGALSKKSCRWTNKDNPTTVQRPSPQECLCTFAHFALCLVSSSHL